MPGKWQLSLVASVTSLVIAAAYCAHACPYCPPTDATLSEKLAESDTACVVKFLSSKNGEELSMQTTTFQIKQLMKPSKMFKTDEQIVTNFGVTANPGDTYLLMGQLQQGTMDWSLPIEIDEVSREYVRQSPSPELRPKADRLAYFFRFLDTSIPVISNDAFGEFARADFEDVKQLLDKLPHDKVRTKVRKWLADPNPQLVVRRAFYGMLLGLCGNADDAEYLKREILAPIDPQTNRLGIEGMMGGYLILTGQAGLRMLVETKIDSLPAEMAVDDPRISDLNALRMTLNFLWDFRHSQFGAEPLRAAMRHYLDRPEFAELAVVDLSRWKDWTSLDPLIAAYGRDPWETRSAKEKIVAFVLSCRKDTKGQTGAEAAARAAKAQQFLDSLEPDFVQSVQRMTGIAQPRPKPPAKPTDDRSE